MNKTIISVSAIIVVVNLLLGLIISSFGWINIVSSTTVIFLTALMMILANGNKVLKDGYRVSLLSLIPIFGLTEYLFAVFMPNRFVNNWCLILIIILLAAEAIFMLAANSVSHKIR